MEDKNINLEGRPKSDPTNIPGCTVWIFGNEDSADNDLKDKVNIKEDE